MRDNDRPCWDCQARPRRKPGLFYDVFCVECGARHDALTPVARQENNKRIFDRNIAATGGGLAGPELRGMIAQVARDELKKIRGGASQ